MPEWAFVVSVPALYRVTAVSSMRMALVDFMGVTLTDAGATYPGGIDPRDRNLRIAPTYPSCEELQTAIDILCVCVKLAACERLLNES